MRNSIVIIRSPDFPYPLEEKLCGLFLLERNIKLFGTLGAKQIILALNETEKKFFDRQVKSHVKKYASKISFGTPADNISAEWEILSNHFIQPHYLNNKTQYFTDSSGTNIPVESEDVFLIKAKEDFKKAVQKISAYIVKNTGGFLAQKVNKRISIPMSIQIAKTRIHPNILTIINAGIGLASSICLLLAARMHVTAPDPGAEYMFMAIGGLLFQCASVFDGIDGEVAKFTFTVSKIGGWLDTIGDNMTLILFLISSAVIHFVYMGGIMSLFSIGVLFLGLAVMLGIMVSYLSRYSQSGSLVAYDREFLQKLPKDDPVVNFALKTKYFTKKEFFSLAFCIMAFTGILKFLVPVVAGAMVMSACVLTILRCKYENPQMIREIKEKN